MKNEITITEADFDTAIKTVMHKDIEDPRFDGHPASAMLYIMGGATFARDVMRVLFGEEGETGDQFGEKTQTEPDVEQMREELVSFCRHKSCLGCPLDKYGFECGRGKFFNCDVSDSGYMTDESIAKHYRAMKGAKHE